MLIASADKQKVTRARDEEVDKSPKLAAVSAIAAMKLIVSLALEPAVRDALDELAEREERSRSSIASRLLREVIASCAVEARQSEQLQK